MRLLRGIAVFILSMSCAPVFGAAGAPSPANLALGEKALGGMPAWFEPNRGQLDPKVRFSARSAQGRLAIHETGARLSYPQGSLDLTLAGADRNARHVGEQTQRARTNYMVGRRPDQWKMDVPHFARVRWTQPYPGIDVAYYFNDARLEYDLLVAPGADPSRIRLKFSGAKATHLDPDGALRFDLGGVEVRQLPPVAYQQIGGKRVKVDARYQVASRGEVRIALGAYDRTGTLVIDPILYAGYTKGQENQIVRAVAVDKNGNVWIAGSAFGEVDVTDLTEPYKNYSSYYRDVFVAEFSLNEQGDLSLIYWTYLGGSDYEEATALGVNADGWVYVAGETSSSDFPTAGTQLQTTSGGGLTDAFLFVIDPSVAGTDSLKYSSFWGGDKDESVRGMALDASGNVAVIGTTASQTLTAVEFGVQGSNRGGWDIFILKVDPKPDSSQTLLYSSFFGGDSTDIATGVAVNAAGNLVYFTGYTFSSDFPTTSDGWQTTERGYGDAFIVKLDLNLSGLESLVYGTCVGGTDLDLANGIDVDASGGVWITGYTLSVDFPVTADAAQPLLAGVVDGFVVRFETGANQSAPLQYSTYLGGSDADVPNVVKVLSDGRVAVAGYTLSADMPGRGNSPAVGMVDAFVTVFDPAKPGAEGLVSTTTFGGAYIEAIIGLAVDASGNLWAAGSTYSPDLATTDWSGKPGEGGMPSGFLLKIQP